MNKIEIENDALEEYFYHFDKIYNIKNFSIEYPLLCRQYKIIKTAYFKNIATISPFTYRAVLKSILNLDAQLQIMTSLLKCGIEDGVQNIDEKEILRCTLSDYQYYYLESFSYRLNDSPPHTILHFFS
ncbi:TPA: hypothetical protein U2K93_001645 [Enterococcus faecalis]|nr:hypothetical protein [Enterococcus faecalis]HEM7729862.1 hypothetical protein [Enterococcus faecalis]